MDSIRSSIAYKINFYHFILSIYISIATRERPEQSSLEVFKIAIIVFYVFAEVIFIIIIFFIELNGKIVSKFTSVLKESGATLFQMVHSHPRLRIEST